MGERAERRKRAEPLSVWAHPPAAEAKAGGKDLPLSASSGASGSPLSSPHSPPLAIILLAMAPTPSQVCQLQPPGAINK